MPKSNEFVALDVREEPGKIVQEGQSLRGESRQRWTISGITGSSFLWQGESSTDGGTSWRLEQEMRATRRLG
jgi:hypothetical protein